MNKKSLKNKSEITKYIGNYQIIKKIGEGSYAKIYKVKKDNSDTLYVLKNIPVSEEDYSSMNEILNESSILSHCDNIYVIKYYDSFFYNGTFNIITEFCPYGDLFGYIKFYKVRGSRIEEKIIWIIFIQLSLGLGYLHHKKILHRDIKTKNIFIKNNLTVKIGDFGIAKILSSTSSYAHTFIGTPYYISPELCKDQPYNDKSDVWALGCVLYELCTLNHPFEGGTQVEIYEKIITQKFKSINPEYSSDLKKMIDLLLEKDEKKRPKMKDILKMKSVVDRANKYNIELDIYDTIDEEKNSFKNKNKSENYEIDIKNNLKKNNYGNYIKNSINSNNNKEILKNSGKKEVYEKSPENNSNKSNKNKYENENKNKQLRIDNVLKNQFKQKNNNKNKSSLNKLSNILSSKNKSVSNIQEDDPSLNAAGNQHQQQGNNNNININNNNQPPQYIKQFRDIINIDKLNNNNKIKFSSPNEINNRKIKESINTKGKIKSLQTGNIFQSGKIMNKIEKEKSEINNNKKEISQESSLYNISNNSNKNNEYNIILNKNNNDNNNNNNENYYSVNNNQSNYYYYKKEAILKKQQQQRNYLNKKEKDKENNNDINKIKYNQKFSNLISKSRTSSDLMTEKNQKISISEDKETIKENENYLSDENSNDNNNNNKETQNRINNKIIIPSPLSSVNKSTNNLKEFTLEKIPTQKLNNSFTLEQNKENVKMYIESNNTLNEKSNNEVILENIKLQKLKEDTIKKIKKNESEMKSISYGVYQHVINMYKAIEGDNKDITALTDSLQKYMRQNLIIKDDKESEQLYKTFKKSFFNYILCEVELNNVEKQIEKRKIVGKWDLTQNDNNNNMRNKFEIQ